MHTRSRRSWLTAISFASLVGAICMGGSVRAQTATITPLTWTEVGLNSGNPAEATLASLNRSSALSAVDPSYGAKTDQSLQGITTIVLENDAAAHDIMLDSCTNGNCQNITASQFARSVQKLPSNVPFVLGRYSPMNAELLIDIFKVVRGASTQNPTAGYGQVVALYHASFTPLQGTYWVASKRYSGDPFARFACPAPVTTAFCNIGMDGVEVAVGHAMRLVGAPVGVLGVANSQTSSTVTTSGDETNQSTTVVQGATLGITWYIAAPTAFQPSGTAANGGSGVNGSSAVICAAEVSANNCAPTDVAYAGAVFNQWNGGSLPNTPQSISGITSTATTTLAGSAGASAQAFAAFASTLSSNVAFLQAFSGDPAMLESGNTVLATLQNELPAPTNSTPVLPTISAGVTSALAPAQNSLYASYSKNSSTISQAAGTGLVSVTAVGSALTTAMAATESTGILLATPGGAPADLTTATYGSVTNNGTTVNYGLPAIQTYAFGTCAANKTTANCAAAGTSAGTIPRLDSYTEVNMTTVYRDTTN